MAASPSCDLRQLTRILGLTSVALLLIAGTLEAGILAGDGNAIVSGRADFFFDAVNIADVEYAVYNPGQTFPGGTSYVDEYVYAYQIFVDDTFIMGLTLQLDGDEEAKNQDSASDLPSVVPSNMDVSGDSAVWDFIPPGSLLDAGKKSDILYFSSPFMPEEAGSSLWRGGSDQSDRVDLPSPSNVPEPVTLTLLAVGAAVLLLFRIARRCSTIG